MSISDFHLLKPSQAFPDLVLGANLEGKGELNLIALSTSLSFISLWQRLERKRDSTAGIPEDP